MFFGTPLFSAKILETLLSTKHEVLSIFSGPDQRQGRGKTLLPSPVKVLGQNKNIPVITDNPLQRQTLKYLKENPPDLFLIVAFGYIIGKELLDIPKYGCINIHASLLPAWRGAAPIERSILNGDLETGITYMQMEEGLDTGAILRSLRCKIDFDDTGGTLKEKLLLLSQDSLEHFLSDLESKKLQAAPQIDKDSTYANKIEIKEAQIRWHDPAEKILKEIKAFNPKPGAFTFLKGKRIKILSANLTKNTQLNPGKFTKTKHEFIVGCRNNTCLRIEELQVEGKKISPIKDILNSNDSIFKEESFD